MESVRIRNPIAFHDPNGKWAESEHNDIIDKAFQNTLDAYQRDILKRASVAVDRDQSSDGAYMHGMRSPSQTPFEARALGDAFITMNLQAAVALQIEFERNQYAPEGWYTVGTLMHFGYALHTVTDRTSPWHMNHENEWSLTSGRGWGAAKGAAHGLAEYRRGSTREGELGMAIHEARLLWDRFQNMLEKEREKERKRRDKEEEERKKKEKEKD